MGLEISVTEKESGIFTVSPKGEINTETYKSLEDRLKDMITRASALVFDMSAVTYISSMGLSAIFRIKIAIEQRNGTIALVDMQPQVKLVFDTMKILTPQMFASLEEADDYLDRFLDGVQKGKIKPRGPLE